MDYFGNVPTNVKTPTTTFNTIQQRVWNYFQNVLVMLPNFKDQIGNIPRKPGILWILLGILPEMLKTTL